MTTAIKDKANGMPPERALVQRLDALETANEVRTYRAKLKKDMKAGRVTIVQLLLNPPKHIMTMKLWDLMVATPKYGRVKTNKALTQCRISPSRTVQGITERQRGEIVNLIRSR